MKPTCHNLEQKKVALRGGVFHQRFLLNRNYVASLKHENLLQNFLLEAGLTAYQLRNSPKGSADAGDERHWGWESPTCQVRGHFLGHWLSAAARIWATNGDPELKQKADAIVADLARCQQRNGGEWCGPFPEKYMTWLANKAPTWATQYIHHKTLMGLYDMHAYAGSGQALEIADRFASWFHRWCKNFGRDQMDNILENETGGMLESWANLYGATGEHKYLDLIERYTRRRLFDPLLKGKDTLTNMHANTTIPEAHGAARCYEVTDEERWRKIAEAYWKCAVTNRGTFCTGSQTAGEIWTPPFEFAARRGDKNQEHCVVYNMIRLADYLFRWTGEAQYADYIERNLYNGILAQQNPGTGMVTYFLPLEAGARKQWGHPTYDFWCCHGSLVQAHSIHNTLIYHPSNEGLMVAQYIPSDLNTEVNGVKVHVGQEPDHQNHGSSTDNSSAAGSRHRPSNWTINMKVECATPVKFTLSLRLPEWLRGKAEILINGQPHSVRNRPPAFEPIRRTWKDDSIKVILPKALWTSPIPDEPDMVAFMDGPIALAGLCEHETRLCGNKDLPETLLVRDNERQWGNWLENYRTVGQHTAIRFKPLHEVVDERYTMYFPCHCAEAAAKPAKRKARA